MAINKLPGKKSQRLSHKLHIASTHEALWVSYLVKFSTHITIKQLVWIVVAAAQCGSYWRNLHMHPSKIRQDGCGGDDLEAYFFFWPHIMPLLGVLIFLPLLTISPSLPSTSLPPVTQQLHEAFLKTMSPYSLFLSHIYQTDIPSPHLDLFIYRTPDWGLKPGLPCSRLAC